MKAILGIKLHTTKHWKTILNGDKQHPVILETSQCTPDCRSTFLYSIYYSCFWWPIFLYSRGSVSANWKVLAVISIISQAPGWLSMLNKFHINAEAFWTLWLLVRKGTYTNWAIATGRGISVPTFADGGVSHGRRGRNPTTVNLSFLDLSRYFFFQVASHLTSRGWVDPVSEPLLLRKSGIAGNRTRDLWVCSRELWPLDHRGGSFIKNTVKLTTDTLVRAGIGPSL
jgi:hypothetical protein